MQWLGPSMSRTRAARCACGNPVKRRRRRGRSSSQRTHKTCLDAAPRGSRQPPAKRRRARATPKRAPSVQAPHVAQEAKGDAERREELNQALRVASVHEGLADAAASAAHHAPRAGEQCAQRRRSADLGKRRRRSKTRGEQASVRARRAGPGNRTRRLHRRKRLVGASGPRSRSAVARGDHDSPSSLWHHGDRPGRVDCLLVP